MSAQNGPINWPACQIEDCRGRQVEASERCLAHTDREEREAILAGLADGAAIEVAAGVQFTEDLLADLLAALPRNDRGAPMLHEADFRLAVLPGLRLEEATVVNARFGGASFQGPAWFDQVTFQGNVDFQAANFQNNVWFGGARFEGHTGFDEASFQRGAYFGGASFQGDADFSSASFQEFVIFDRVSAPQ